MKTPALSPYHQKIRDLSDDLIKIQKPIRILDAIKWSRETENQFFLSKCKKLPKVTKNYYQQHPLPFDPVCKIDEFYALEREIHQKLGEFNAIGRIMTSMCNEYRTAVRMLQARGTPDFSKLSQELYGSSSESFYAGGPTLTDLADILSEALINISDHVDNELDVKCYDSKEAVFRLQQKLNHYFTDPKANVQVLIDDGIVADAAAGANVIKLRRDAMFSERQLRILEVHEGWVHVGTTLNGQEQPICTFLSKGPPKTTIFQEGLAVIIEIFTFNSHPNRIRKLTSRIKAISMAEQGANFIEVFNYFRETGLDEKNSYTHTTRVFRGSTATGAPFTKDLAYSKGFILIYNYIRLAIRQGLIKRLPLLFLGKTSLNDLKIYEELLAEGIVSYPKYLPPNFRDLAGLSCWMSYSLFLNRLDLDALHESLKTIL